MWVTGPDPATDRRVITVATATRTAFAVSSAYRLPAERAPHTTLRVRTSTVPSEATFVEQGVENSSSPNSSSVRRVICFRAPRRFAIRGC